MSQIAQHNDIANETSPLLPQQHEHPSPEKHTHQRWWLTIPFSLPIATTTLVPLLGLLTVFTNEAEFYFKSPAQLRAIEALACLEYYTRLDDPIADLGRNIPELMCKGTKIQERVALLNSTLTTIRMCSAVLGTCWILAWFKAERRRPVLILHKFNLLASNSLLFLAYYGYPTIPIWVITLTGATSIFGGNFDLATSTLYAAYADVIPDPTKRSNLIFITTSLQYAAQAISTPLTGKLMNLNGKGSTPQVSFAIATAFSVLSLCISLFFFPETTRLDITQQQQQHQTETSPLISEPEPDPSSSTKPSLTTILRADFGLLRIFFLLLATFAAIASTRLVDWYGVIQYPSIKFHWTVSRTTYLICMQAILSFLVFILIIPKITNLAMHKFKLSSRATSVGLVVISSTILALCSIMFGLPGTTAPVFVGTVAVYTVGSGVNSALQMYTVSVSSSPRSSGASLTVISLAAQAGKVAASVIWPSTLALGLEHPSGKLGGLPFFVVALLFVVVAVSIVIADWGGKKVKNENEAE